MKNIRRKLEYYERYNQTMLKRVALALDIGIFTVGFIIMYLIINQI